MDTPQYFEAQPTTPSRRREITVHVRGRAMRLATDRGVFSAERLDPGTSILLQHGPAPAAEGTFLDLGCGTGAIAIHLARTSPAATVWAIDVNERAVELCALSAGLNDVSTVRAAVPDAVPGDVVFDEIWSNPPIRVGKAALHEMLARWLARLAPDGRAMLVVSKHLGSDSLARWIGEQGFTCTRLSSHKGYRLLRVTRPA